MKFYNCTSAPSKSWTFLLPLWVNKYSIKAIFHSGDQYSNWFNTTGPFQDSRCLVKGLLSNGLLIKKGLKVLKDIDSLLESRTRSSTSPMKTFIMLVWYLVWNWIVHWSRRPFCTSFIPFQNSADNYLLTYVPCDDCSIDLCGKYRMKSSILITLHLYLKIKVNRHIL